MALLKLPRMAARLAYRAQSNYSIIMKAEALQIQSSRGFMGSHTHGHRVPGDVVMLSCSDATIRLAQVCGGGMKN